MTIIFLKNISKFEYIYNFPILLAVVVKQLKYTIMDAAAENAETEETISATVCLNTGNNTADIHG